jgi:hypothetical protein
MENTIQSFLMIGQSNMAGRGYLKDVKPIYDEHIKMLVNGRWQTMTEPINFDRPFSGIGLAASFAAAWRIQNPQGQIGLIPCADGGSSLDDWTMEGALFRNAVFQAKQAQRNSVLAGILWHQGENDSFGGRSSIYRDKLSAIVQSLRKELEAFDIPFIAGGLGEFLSGGRYGKYFTEFNAVNHALLEFAECTSHSYFVSASGLTANADGLHFDALSQRKFGLRYFEAYFSKKNIHSPLSNENTLINIIQDRVLSKNEKNAILQIKFAGGLLSLQDFEDQLAKLDQ